MQARYVNRLHTGRHPAADSVTRETRRSLASAVTAGPCFGALRECALISLWFLLLNVVTFNSCVTYEFSSVSSVTFSFITLWLEDTQAFLMNQNSSHGLPCRRGACRLGRTAIRSGQVTVAPLPTDPGPRPVLFEVVC